MKNLQKREKLKIRIAFCEHFSKIRQQIWNQHKILRFFIPLPDFFWEKKTVIKCAKNEAFSHILPKVKLIKYFANIYKSLLDSYKVLNIEASSHVTYGTCPLVFLFYSNAKGTGPQDDYLFGKMYFCICASGFKIFLLDCLCKYRSQSFSLLLIITY